MSSGGGSSGGSGFQQTTSEVTVPDWVAQQVQNNIATANQLAATTYQQSPTPTVAPMTADQTAAIQQVRDLQGTYDPGFNQAIGQVSNLPASITSLLSPEIPGAEATAVQQLQRQGALTGQQIAAQAVGAGALGGTRYGVQQSYNDSETQQNIANAVNQIASGGFNQAAGAALTGASDLGALTAGNLTGALTGANALYQAGSAQQAQTQAGYAAALQQWQQQQNYPYQQLALQQSALAGSPYGNTVTSSQPYSSNGLASALGDIAAGVPIAAILSNWTGATPAIQGALSSAGSSIGSALGLTSAAPTIGTAAMPVFDAGAAAVGTDAAATAGTAAAGDAAATAGTAAAGDAAATGAAAGGAAKGASDVAAAAPLVLA